MMQIAKANLEAKNTRAALQILKGILGLKVGDSLKAEAQYLIAQTLEEEVGNRSYSEKERLRALGPAIAAYRDCADTFPDSPFAGQALGKVIDYHLEAKDYGRCKELLQTVFVDFPDAPFLDEMLLKWGLVLARSKDYPAARDKLTQLLRDYPNSASASKAQKLVSLIEKRIN
jgi:tetratricopeptide (TPR) repeat protein